METMLQGRIAVNEATTRSMNGQFETALRHNGTEVVPAATTGCSKPSQAVPKRRFGEHAIAGK
jgi:hypothetical protein